MCKKDRGNIIDDKTKLKVIKKNIEKIKQMNKNKNIKIIKNNIEKI